MLPPTCDLRRGLPLGLRKTPSLGWHLCPCDLSILIEVFLSPNSGNTPFIPFSALRLPVLTSPSHRSPVGDSDAL